MKKRGRIASALLLTVVLAASIVVVPKVQAADAVKTDQLCSVGFQIAGDFAELKDGTVNPTINLYKVASINGSGKYTTDPDGSFASMNNDLNNVNDKTTAEQWAAFAKTANDTVSDNALAADKTATLTNGVASVIEVPTGLYLVRAESTMSPYYEYNFTPYLLSLPNNYYADTQDDTWVYDVTALDLKVEKLPRFGSLEIVKTLRTMNATMSDKSTFVFEAVITPPTGDPYKKNVALTFDSATSKTAVINNIPAGSRVDVTEVYDGASYEAVGATTAMTTIAADTASSVSFTNDHNGSENGGYGIVNNFKYEQEENSDVSGYHNYQKESNTNDDK